MRDAFYYFGSTPSELKKEFKNQSLNLTTQINRKIREDGASDLIVTYTYPLPWGRKDAQKHFEKKSKKWMKILDKYINMRDSVTVSSDFYDFKGDSVGVYFTWIPKSSVQKKPFYIDFEKSEIPEILPPVYHSLMPEEAFQLNVQDRDFLRMIENIDKTIRFKDQKIHFFIQSAADGRPNKNYSDRSYLALKRGQVLQQELEAFLNTHYPDSIEIVTHLLPWVKGHDERSTFITQDVQANNFITIVPVLEVDSTKKLLPYKVNFDQSFLEIDNSSPFYNAFVDGLVDIINRQGAVQVILESSSSKVPIQRGPSPEECSVIRSESMVEKL